MRMKLKRYETAGFFFTAIAGCLLHFMYGWSNDNPLMGLLSPVNESTWEHLKLLFFPYLLFMLAENFLLQKSKPHFFTSKLLGLLTGLAGIPLLFYAYTGIAGRNFLVADILVFLLSTAAAYWVSWKLLSSSSFQRKGSPSMEKLSVAVILLLVLFFFFATYFPPHLTLFQNPET